jgi:hypothetical protein
VEQGDWLNWTELEEEKKIGMFNWMLNWTAILEKLMCFLEDLAIQIIMEHQP